MIVAQNPAKPFDASTEVEILSVLFAGLEPQMVVARLDLVNPTIGVTYQARVYLNGDLISPDVPIQIKQASAVLQSRAFIASPNDNITVKLVGGVADTALLVAIVVITAGFDYSELVTALSQLQVQPTRIILGPCRRRTTRITSEPIIPLLPQAAPPRPLLSRPRRPPGTP
jgi:hypothetical protein